MSQTLFDKYGGVPMITEIVREFYKRMLRRPNLRRYFDDVPMERLVNHQIRFVSLAMGKSPESYGDDLLHQAHLPHRVTGASFDLMVDLFRDTLRSFEVDEVDIDEIVGALRCKRDVIVTR